MRGWELGEGSELAEMFPRELLAADVKSKGEEKVFEALRHKLRDGWQAFHSVSWIARDHASGAMDGEIDFVLCHPEQGILCLEVKGGNLDSHSAQWFSGPPGEQTQIKDPFQQALDHRYALERHITASGLAGAKEWLIMQAIALPDVTVHELSLAPDAPRELIIDRIQMRDLESAIERVLAFHRGSRDKRKAPGVGGARALKELLAPTVHLRVPLATNLVDEYTALLTLTEQQARVLAGLGRTQKLAITGCAGSGKTMLAVEHAKRLAEAGTKVLFVCFNKGLVEHLRERERNSGVEFQTFHKLAYAMAKRAGVAIPIYPPGTAAPPEYFNEILPEALIEAVDKLGPQYQALIVDEAQDLRDDWYETLLMLLEDEDKANVWLFFDDNQKIYESGIKPPDDFMRYDLTVNCRNTQEIHREALKHYQGEITPDVQGPVGRPPEIHHTDDQPATVAKVIKRLCGKEEVPAQDVVVLSAHGVDNSQVYKTLSGDYEFTRKRGELGKKVYFSSIRGFKGLEAPVVILCELEDLDEAIDQQLYVAISRARTHCAIVGAPPVA